MVNKEIIALRHTLHQHPELSNHEVKTSALIHDFINDYQPDDIIKLSKTGIAFVFNGKEKGETILFRAELDALPIKEINNIKHSSVNANISHVCGHDGHMAILAGLAQKIAGNRPAKGRVVLLFQPAEEIEQGARDVVNDPNFVQIEPHYVFALHNIPGFDLNTVLIKNGTFASASKGMTVKLYGKTSHAAEPENGISPANAIAGIITALNELVGRKHLFKDLSMLTYIHILMGEISFGTSPGYAEMRITLRAYENDDMNLLTGKAENIINEISKSEKLRNEISYSEIFPATVNNDECIRFLEQSATENDLKIEYIKSPFKWSEDFAYYSGKYRSVLFGLGAGIHHAQLHNPDYDFPDDLIETGIDLFYRIYKKTNF